MKTIIHVNQHVIKRNTKYSENNPPIIVKTYKGSKNFHSVKILGPAEIISRPHAPLSCGARVWIETNADVVGE